MMIREREEGGGKQESAPKVGSMLRTVGVTSIDAFRGLLISLRGVGLHALDGIRALAVMWVIMVHVYSVHSFVDQADDVMQWSELLTQWYDGVFIDFCSEFLKLSYSYSMVHLVRYMKGVANGDMGVDVFFVLSGLKPDT
jgi:hypothetical protein